MEPRLLHGFASWSGKALVVLAVAIQIFGCKSEIAFKTKTKNGCSTASGNAAGLNIDFLESGVDSTKFVRSAVVAATTLPGLPPSAKVLGSWCLSVEADSKLVNDTIPVSLSFEVPAPAQAGIVTIFYRQEQGATTALGPSSIIKTSATWVVKLDTNLKAGTYALLYSTEFVASVQSQTPAAEGIAADGKVELTGKHATIAVSQAQSGITWQLREIAAEQLVAPPKGQVLQALTIAASGSTVTAATANFQVSDPPSSLGSWSVAIVSKDGTYTTVQTDVVVTPDPQNPGSVVVTAKTVPVGSVVALVWTSDANGKPATAATDASSGSSASSDSGSSASTSSGSSASTGSGSSASSGSGSSTSTSSGSSTSTSSGSSASTGSGSSASSGSGSSASTSSGAAGSTPKVAPSVPQGLIVAQTSPTSVTTLTLSWSAVSGTGISYNLKACVDSLCSSGCSSTVASSSLSATTPVLADGAHYLCVNAVSSDGLSSAFAATSQAIVVDTTPPALPTGLTLAQTSPTSTSALGLTWVAPPGGASSYRLKACTDTGCTNSCSGVVSISTLSANTPSMADGSYYLCVAAVDQVGNTSAFVATSQSIVVDTVAPAAPSGLTLSQSSPTNVTTPGLTWLAALGGPASYNLKACVNAGCSSSCTNAQNTVSLSGTSTSLSDGSYYLCVNAVDQAGNASAFAASSALVVDATLPTAPTNINGPAAYVNTLTPAVTWTAGSDANLSGYEIKACTSNDCSTDCSAVKSAVASPSNTISLSSGTSYYLCVRTLDSAQNASAYAAAASPIVIDTTVPTAPTPANPPATIVGTSHVAIWTRGTDANRSNDEAKMCTDAGCSLDCTMVSSVNAASTTFTGISPGSKLLCVRTTDLAGNASAFVASTATNFVAPVATTLLVNGGQGQTGLVSANVFSPISVLVLDQAQQPMSGVSVNWTRPVGGALLGSTTSTTGATGIATNTLSLDAVPEVNTITASVNALSVNLNASSKTALSNATQIAVGQYHSCALIAGGTVKCWGSNYSGQVGDGSGINRQLPVPVSGISTATQLALGYSHSCALLSNGQVSCWGSNSGGCLGIGPVPNQLAPTLVSGLSGVSKIAAGQDFNCAVLTDGTAKCWGTNYNGQIGNGDTTSQYTAVAVSSLSNATAIASGGSYSCALISGGGVKCWGANYSGQLGNGTTTNSLVPVSVSGVNTATQISANSHSCALLQDSSIKCWGSNYPSSPTLVSGISSATSVAVGSSYTCATLSDNTLRCWGSNSDGQLGDGTRTNRNAPIQPNLTNVSQVAALIYHSCALINDGTVKCWGYNGSGELGNGMISGATVPTLVPGLTGASRVSANDRYSCASRSDGTVRCWGVNNVGQLGNGSTTASMTPVTASGLTTATTVAGPCALLSNGTVSCWGSGGYGQLGNGSLANQSVPIAVSGLSAVTQLVAGVGHVCSLMSDQTVKCWGAGFSGQIGGDGTTNSTSVPTRVSGLSGVVHIATSYNHNCAALSDGTVRCWGMNGNGQLGNGGSTNVPMPVTVSGLTSVSKVGAGMSHSCAVLNDTTVKCWGSGAGGQLGNGSTSNSTVPVVVSGLSGVSDLALGGEISCARLSSGSVKCWGFNYYGSIGDGSFSIRNLPVSVQGSLTFSQISSKGSAGVCGVTDTATVYCWGLNQSNELGFDWTQHLFPVQVLN